MERFSSPYIMFRIEGRPPTRGGRGVGCGRKRQTQLESIAPKAKTSSRKEKYAASNAKKKIDLAEYTNIARLMAKMAMAGQGWKITDKPLYMVLTVYINYSPPTKKEVVKAIYDSDVPPIRMPLLHTLSKIYIRAFKGVVYEKETQLAGILLLKRYTPGLECVDVLIGQPSTFKELVNDIRNN